MRRILLSLALVALVFAAPAVRAQQVLTLTTPLNYSTTTCTLLALTITPSIGNLAQGAITAQLVGQNGETFVKTYNATTAPTGQTLISQLNTANNSTTSLLSRVYQRLSGDGICVGTVTGAPQH